MPTHFVVPTSMCISQKSLPGTHERDEKRKRRRIGLMAREIERVCVEKIVGEMNELSSHRKSESSNTSVAESILSSEFAIY